MGARYYDPQFGTFLTRDTDLSQKPYAYCDADPINGTDPSGHGVWSNTLGFGLAVVGIAVGVILAPEVIIPAAIIGGGLGGAVGGSWGAVADGEGSGGVALGGLKWGAIGAVLGLAFGKLVQSGDPELPEPGHSDPPPWWED